MCAIEGAGVPYLALEDLVCVNDPSRAIFSVSRNISPLEIIREGDSPPVNEREREVGLNWPKTPDVVPTLRIGVPRKRGKVYGLNWPRAMKQNDISKA